MKSRLRPWILCNSVLISPEAEERVAGDRRIARINGRFTLIVVNSSRPIELAGGTLARPAFGESLPNSIYYQDRKRGAQIVRPFQFLPIKPYLIDTNPRAPQPMASPPRRQYAPHLCLPSARWNRKEFGNHPGRIETDRQWETHTGDLCSKCDR